MSRFTRLSRRVLRVESMVVIALLVLAAAFAVPALRGINPAAAERGKVGLQKHLRTVEQRAKQEGLGYAVLLRPESGTVEVLRDGMVDGRRRHVDVPELTNTLPGGIVVEKTTLLGNRISISANGFLLSSGRITLRAPDGSRSEVMVGEVE